MSVDLSTASVVVVPRCALGDLSTKSVVVVPASVSADLSTKFVVVVSTCQLTHFYESIAVAATSVS